MSLDNILVFLLLVLIIIVLFLACAFVWMTKPGKYRYFDLPVVFAHRGLHDNESVPENSLPAFRAAKDAGLAVELDVHETGDHVLVVCHDSDLERLTGSKITVEHALYDDIKDLCLLGTSEHIPTFEEALSACGGTPVSVEIKVLGTEVDNDYISHIDSVLSKYEGDYSVISFHPSALGWYKLNRPEVLRGQLSSGCEKVEGRPFVGFMLENLMLNYISRPDFISYKFTDKTLGLTMNKIYGTRLVGWTERSMEDVEKAAQEGYSSFTCEGFDLTEV